MSESSPGKSHVPSPVARCIAHAHIICLPSSTSETTRMVQFFGIAAVACTPNLLMATIVSSVFYGKAQIAATGAHRCLQMMLASVRPGLNAGSLHNIKRAAML